MCAGYELVGSVRACGGGSTDVEDNHCLSNSILDGKIWTLNKVFLDVFDDYVVDDADDDAYDDFDDDVVYDDVDDDGDDDDDDDDY